MARSDLVPLMVTPKQADEVGSLLRALRNISGGPGIAVRMVPGVGITISATGNGRRSGSQREVIPAIVMSSSEIGENKYAYTVRRAKLTAGEEGQPGTWAHADEEDLIAFNGWEVPDRTTAGATQTIKLDVNGDGEAEGELKAIPDGTPVYIRRQQFEDGSGGEWWIVGAGVPLDILASCS